LEVVVVPMETNQSIYQMDLKIKGIFAINVPSLI